MSIGAEIENVIQNATLLENISPPGRLRNVRSFGLRHETFLPGHHHDPRFIITGSTCIQHNVGFSKKLKNQHEMILNQMAYNGLSSFSLQNHRSGPHFQAHFQAFQCVQTTLVSQPCATPLSFWRRSRTDLQRWGVDSQSPSPAAAHLPDAQNHSLTCDWWSSGSWLHSMFHSRPFPAQAL